MKHSLTLFLLILFLVFVSCGGFLESFESEENNPHCTIFFHNNLTEQFMFVLTVGSMTVISRNGLWRRGQKR